MGRIFAERLVTQMPDDVLEDLFFGKIDPWENRPSNMEEFQLLNQKMSRLSDTLG